MPEPPAPWEPQGGKEEDWNETEPNQEQRGNSFLWKSSRNKFCVRYESVGTDERDQDDQICQTLPIYVRREFYFSDLEELDGMG
jgi:hypothetical protein